MQFLVQDLQLQLSTKEREWEKKMAEKVKALTEEMDKQRRLHELQGLHWLMLVDVVVG